MFKEPNSNRIGYSESDVSRRNVRPAIVVTLSGASASTSWHFHDVVQQIAATHGYPLTSGVNWYQDKGDTVAGEGDTAHIKDWINRLANKNGGDKHALSALVVGKSAGGVLAWHTFKRNFISLMGDFHRVALVLVDPHGSAYPDDRVGTYCDHQEPVVAQQLPD